LDPNAVVKTESTTPVVKPIDAADFDLSAFSPDDATQVRARMNYIMNSCKYSPKVANNVVNHMIKFLSGHTNIREFKASFINNGSVVDDSLVHLFCGSNLGFKGPKGTGKNVCTEQLANILDMELFNMTMAMDITKDELIGSQAIKEDGTTGVVLSEMLKAAIRGAIIVVDEVNTTNPGITAWMHSLTDGRRSLEVPGVGFVQIHPQTRFIFTMNEGDGYAGTREINEAFEDRFQSIVFTNNPESIIDILVKNVGLSQEDARAFFKYYQIFYSAVYNADESARLEEKYISQRAFIRAGQLWANGMVDTIHDAVIKTLVAPITDAETKEMIESLIQLHYH
jgi:MoxR-like ATPase